MAKLWRIIKSRFRKETGEEWIGLRRQKCKECCYHINPQDKRTAKQKIIKALSDFYTWITLSENDDLGECGICFCPTFYATREVESECSAKEKYGDDKWKSIYIPNTGQNKKWNK